MIGIDSNILLRLLAGDNGEQVAIARRLVASAQGAASVFVSVIVLVETIWVLRRSFRVPTAEIMIVVESLTENADFDIEDRDMVREAVAAARHHNIDITDCLIALRNREKGCDTTLTFDRKAARLADFTLLTAP